jgi:hypothetical protein
MSRLQNGGYPVAAIGPGTIWKPAPMAKDPVSLPLIAKVGAYFGGP